MVQGRIIRDWGDTAKMVKHNIEPQQCSKSKWQFWLLLITCLIAISNCVLQVEGSVLRSQAEGELESTTAVGVDVEDLGNVDGQQGAVTYMAGDGHRKEEEGPHEVSATVTEQSGVEPPGEDHAGETVANEICACHESEKQEEVITEAKHEEVEAHHDEEQTASISSSSESSAAETDPTPANTEAHIPELPSTATYLVISSTEAAATEHQELGESTTAIPADHAAEENQPEVKENANHEEEATVVEMTEEVQQAPTADGGEEPSNVIEDGKKLELAKFEALLNATGPLQQLSDKLSESNIPRKRTKRIKRDQDKPEINGNDQSSSAAPQQIDSSTPEQKPLGNPRSAWGYDIPPPLFIED